MKEFSMVDFFIHYDTSDHRYHNVIKRMVTKVDRCDFAKRAMEYHYIRKDLGIDSPEARQIIFEMKIRYEKIYKKAIAQRSILAPQKNLRTQKKKARVQ